MAETTESVYRVHINASIQDVWDEITKGGEALPFFFNSVMHTPGLKTGAPIRMRTTAASTPASWVRSWRSTPRTGSRIPLSSPNSMIRRAR